MDFEIECQREADGRWLAEVPQLPGVLAYGESASDARAEAQVQALRILAERLDATAGPDPGPMVEAPWNLGPMSKRVLERAGILDREQLRQLGSARAYVCVKLKYGRAPRSLLWALEGALSNRPWQQVATEERLSLLLEVEAIERGEREHAL